MIIAIPSHQRFQMLKNKTLALLSAHNFPTKDIYIFVSPTSYKQYLPLKELGYNIILSKDTILDTRNHIIDFFYDATPIVEMDDDVEDIYITKKDQKETPVENLYDLFISNFKLLGSHGLWGINASHNPFFGSGKDQWGRRTIINSCLGYYNNKKIKLSVTEKEDYERVLQFDALELPILKRGGFGTKTKYWKNPGGIQDYCSFQDRVQRQRNSAIKLIEKYPDKCYTVLRKNGLTDIRFRR